MSDEKEGSHARIEDVRQCSKCQQKVPTSEGAYIGGGRWCCLPCAAALYVDEDDLEEEDD